MQWKRDPEHAVQEADKTYTKLLEIDLWTARWLPEKDSSMTAVIRTGLEKVARAIEERPGDRAAWRIWALLEAEMARVTGDPGTRAAAYGRAIEAFAEADRLGPGWSELDQAERSRMAEFVSRDLWGN